MFLDTAMIINLLNKENYTKRPLIGLSKPVEAFRFYKGCGL